MGFWCNFGCGGWVLCAWMCIFVGVGVGVLFGFAVSLVFYYEDWCGAAVCYVAADAA